MSVLNLVYRFNAISIKNPSKLFCEYQQTDSKIYMERQQTQDSQHNTKGEQR